MQIHEVMLPTAVRENRFTNFLSGVVGGLGQGLGVSVPQVSSPSQNTAFQDPAEAKQRAMDALEPQIMQLGNGLASQWSAVVTDLMRRTTDPATGQPVKNISSLDATKLNRMIQSQLSRSLLTLTKGQSGDYNKLPAAIDRANRAEAAAAVQSINTALANIMATNPDRTNQKNVQAQWQQVAKNLFQIVVLATYNPVRTKPVKFKFTQDAAGNLLINRMLYKNTKGQPVPMNSAAGRRVMAQYQAGTP